MRVAVIAFLVLPLAGVSVISALADSTQDKKSTSKLPLGTWSRTAGDSTLRFEIKPSSLRATLTNLNIEAEADYALTNEGIAFGRVRQIGVQGVAGLVDVGMLFSFRYRLKGDTLTISNYEGPGGVKGREMLEGEYQASHDDSSKE